MDISVLIPTFNQSRKLALCLKYLSELISHQISFEVLVIDNGSTDDTKEMALTYKNRIMNLDYIYCSDPGLMAARHRGAEKAMGEILCFLDDDSLVSHDWLLAMDESFNNKDVVIAGGPCVPKYEAEPPEWVEYFWSVTEKGKSHNYLSLTNFGVEKIFVDPVHIFGCNYAIRKKTFFEFGGTNPDYYPGEALKYSGNGETGLSEKLGNKGLNAFYNPKAKIMHLIPANRLTHEYFNFKQKYIGIGASYQFIRKNYGLDGYPKLSFSKKEKLFLKIRKPLGKVKRSINRAVHKALVDNNESSDIISMREQLAKSFQDGYSIHQKMFQNDSRFREWVLRENYLGDNGKLPLV